MSASPQTHLQINVHKDPDDAPKFSAEEFTGVILSEANVVRNGTVEGRSTVDLVFEDAKGKKFVMMLTGRLIRNLAAIIGDEG
jgi:hypothetical protein